MNNKDTKLNEKCRCEMFNKDIVDTAWCPIHQSNPMNQPNEGMRERFEKVYEPLGLGTSGNSRWKFGAPSPESCLQFISTEIDLALAKQRSDIVEMKEKLADLEHDRWANWQAYLHKFLTYHEVQNGDKKIACYLLSADSYEHWERQINTNYKDLSEEEKNSDRIKAQKTIDLIISTITKDTKD